MCIKKNMCFVCFFFNIHCIILSTFVCVILLYFISLIYYCGRDRKITYLVLLKQYKIPRLCIYWHFSLFIIFPQKNRCHGPKDICERICLLLITHLIIFYYILKESYHTVLSVLEACTKQSWQIKIELDFLMKILLIN